MNVDKTIIFNQDINTATATSLFERVNNAIDGGATRILLNISSNGGETVTAISMYNYLKSLPVQIDTCNIGNVASAAVLLYLAGKVRYCKENSKFLIHPPTLQKSVPMDYIGIKEVLLIVEADIVNYIKTFKSETANAKTPFDINTYLTVHSATINKENAFNHGIVTTLE